MNYLRELNAFYDRLELNDLSASAIALWHALMHINNKAGWTETFTVAASVLCVKSGLKSRNFYNARNELKQKELIDFKTRKGNQSSVYKILSLCANSAGNHADNTAHNIENNPLPANNADNSAYNSAESSAYNRAGNSATLIKQKQKRNKNINNTAAAASLDRIVLFFQETLAQDPTSSQIAWFEELVNQGMQADVILNAIQKAEDAGAPFKYAKKILETWSSLNILSMTDVEEEQRHYQQRKETKNKQQEVLPKWFEEEKQRGQNHSPKNTSKSPEEVERKRQELESFIKNYGKENDYESAGTDI